jgi:hypothetical protein
LAPSGLTSTTCVKPLEQLGSDIKETLTLMYLGVFVIRGLVAEIK